MDPPPPRTIPASAPQSRKVRIVCISDTHNHGPGEGWTLPKGDVLIHAGDLTNAGSGAELKKATRWLERAEFGVKIVVAGNHDLCLDPDHTRSRDGSADGIEHWRSQGHDPSTGTAAATEPNDYRRILDNVPGIAYLDHKSVTIKLPNGQNLRVFGSPYSPRRSTSDDWAFQYPESDAETLWDEIPQDVDILITHTPPAGHCDASRHWREGGCAALTRALERARPMLHVCGHCHEGRGAEVVRWGDGQDGNGKVVRTWTDPGRNNKKQSLLTLSSLHENSILGHRQETAIVNASITATSWGKGAKAFNKPIVVDVMLPVQTGSSTRDGLHEVRDCDTL